MYLHRLEYYLPHSYNYWSSEIPKDTVKSLSCIFGDQRYERPSTIYSYMMNY